MAALADFHEDTFITSLPYPRIEDLSACPNWKGRLVPGRPFRQKAAWHKTRRNYVLVRAEALDEKYMHIASTWPFKEFPSIYLAK